MTVYTVITLHYNVSIAEVLNPEPIRLHRDNWQIIGNGIFINRTNLVFVAEEIVEFFATIDKIVIAWNDTSDNKPMIAGEQNVVVGKVRTQPVVHTRLQHVTEIQILLAGTTCT